MVWCLFANISSKYRIHPGRYTNIRGRFVLELPKVQVIVYKLLTKVSIDIPTSLEVRNGAEKGTCRIGRAIKSIPAVRNSKSQYLER